MKTTEHYLRVALFVFGLIAELPAKKLQDKICKLFVAREARRLKAGDEFFCHQEIYIF